MSTAPSVAVAGAENAELTLSNTKRIPPIAPQESLAVREIDLSVSDLDQEDLLLRVTDRDVVQLEETTDVRDVDTVLL